ncbi:YhjD/YihY/BrkB family envelope integrity protein [Streptomyces sp. NPDC046853]|uniref:YhjD/YihY/BrkB family envelope integrity protein n=1 Tax=Streptomyces sp. NPDC046853 TaxID=3154920 RepID=UPI0033C8360D
MPCRRPAPSEDPSNASWPHPALMALAAMSALIVVFTGGFANRAGSAFGVGDTALTVRSVAKWSVLAVLLVLMMALLFWVTPNVKGRGWRWVTPGGFLALLIWLAVSAGFTVYVSGFSSYNKAYRTSRHDDRTSRRTQDASGDRPTCVGRPLTYELLCATPDAPRELTDHQNRPPVARVIGPWPRRALTRPNP